jgi:hypothetical protein
MDTTIIDQGNLSPEIVPRFDWLRIWINALTHPSVPFYERLAASPRATAGRGYRWIAIATAVNTVFFTLRTTPFGITFFVDLIRNIIFFTTLSLVSTAIFLRITNWFARRLDGTGTLASYTFVYAAFAAPLAIIYPSVYWFTFGRWLYILHILYSLLLGVIAIKAVHKLSWERAIVSQFFLLLASICTLVEQIQLMASVGTGISVAG